MDRVKGEINIPGIDNYRSMVYNSDEMLEKIKKLELVEKDYKIRVRVTRSRINAHIEEYEKLLKKEGKKND